jgi:hypothetical protein
MAKQVLTGTARGGIFVPMCLAVERSPEGEKPGDTNYDERTKTMKTMSRREVMGLAGTTGAAVLAASAAAADSPGPKRKANTETPVPSKASADSVGARELFAVVDSDGNIKRCLHAITCKRLELGVYEVIFNRDVRRGVYLATCGGHGYDGTPLSATATVMGRATDPHGVLVFTINQQGDPVATGFHLLVVCPEGYA